MAKPTIDKWKTKKFFEVIAPPMFQEKHIGETIAANPKQISGRIIETTLGNLTGDARKQKVKLRFRIEELKGEKATTSFLGHIVAQDFGRALVRRRSSKIYVNQKVTTKDNKTLRIKSFILTPTQVNQSTRKTLANKYREFMENEAKAQNFRDFMNNILSNKTSMKSKGILKKIHPVKQSVVEKSEVLGTAKNAEPK